MSNGQGSLESYNSYVALGRETTFKTYDTCTSQLEFLSSSLTTMKENKILEQIDGSRVYSKRIGLAKMVEGDLEFYAFPQSNAFVYLLQNAMGGANISSATATGETIGGAAFTHTLEIGNFTATHSSLCINERKGDATNGFVYEYNGIRVNEFGFSAELDEALKCTSSMVAVNSTQTSNDVESALTDIPSDAPLSFVNGRLSIESTFAALTSTSYWHVQSINFGLGNNLKSDNESRRIGSDVLDVLPPGIAAFSFTATMRFDTLTAYDAMLNETQLSAQLEFLGSTLTGSNQRQKISLDLPVIYINNAGDPEIAGPDEILTSELDIHVLKDVSSTTGYALKAYVTNLQSSY